MLPVSPNELREFIPYEYSEKAKAKAKKEKKSMARYANPPKYFVAVPDFKSRANMRRAMMAEGAIMPSQDIVFETLRKGIKEEVAPDQQEELLSIVEAVEQGKADEDTLIQYTKIERQIASVTPDLARLMGEVEFYRQMMPIIACQMFLKGAENIKFELEFKSGKLTDGCLNKLPSSHITEIGVFALSLMSLSEEQEKNSDSQLQSVTSTTNSAA